MNTIAEKIIKVMRIDLEQAFKSFIPSREEKLEQLFKNLHHEKPNFYNFELDFASDAYYIDDALDTLHYYNYSLKELIKKAASMQEELEELEKETRIKFKTIERLFSNNNCD